MTKKADWDDIWSDDLLDRQREAKFLHRYLVSASNNRITPHGRKSVVLNLKATWGSGKSFFLKRFAESLKAEGHNVATLDAWKSDPEIDPLVSMVAAIRHELDPDYTKTQSAKDALSQIYKAGGNLVLQTVKGGLIRLGAKVVGQETLEYLDDTLQDAGFTGEEIEELEDITEESLRDAAEHTKPIPIRRYFAGQLRDVYAQKNAVEEFNKGAEKLVRSEASDAPFFVFIDELDRCRPTYAIRLLERINHLFDIDGIVFVVGTDSDELEHAICAIYGEKFNSKSYLRRFFSGVYHLSSPSLAQLIDLSAQEYGIDFSKFYEPSRNDPEQAFRQILSAALDNAREVRQTVSLIQSAQFGWRSTAKIDIIWLTILAVLQIKGAEYLVERSRAGQIDSENALLKKLSTVKFQNFSDSGSGRVDIPADNYFHKIARLSATSAEEALKRLNNSQDSISSNLLKFVAEDVNRLRRENNREGSPLWADYIQLVRSAAHFEPLPEEAASQ